MGRRKYFQWMWLKKSFDIVCRTIVVRTHVFRMLFCQRDTLTQISGIYLLDLGSFSHRFLFIYSVYIFFVASLTVADCGFTESTNSNIKIAKCRSNGNEARRASEKKWYIKRGKWKWQNKRNQRTSSGIINIIENKVSVMLMMCVCVLNPHRSIIDRINSMSTAAPAPLPSPPNRAIKVNRIIKRLKASTIHTYS